MSMHHVISKPKDHILIQISDTHLMTDPNDGFIGINPEQNFHQVIAQIQQQHSQIDTIIHTGDVAQEANPTTYQRYQAYMQRLNIPFFQIPGNHDNLEYFPFAASALVPAVIDLDPWRLILLNSAVPNQVDGWIQTEQLQLLEELLYSIQDKFVLLACHHHPFAMKSKWIDQHKLKNTDQLTDVLAKFKNIKIVLFGHVHQESNTLWQETEFLSTPATCAQFKPLSEDFALDEAAPGYRYLHLKSDGQFETSIYRLEGYVPTINKEISGY